MEEPQRKKIFKIKKTAIIMGMVFLAVFFVVLPALAQQPPPLNLGLEYASATGLANTDIRMIIAKIIRVALGLLGLVALCFTIYGGYVYMTAGGNEEKVATAKKILKNMVIGLAIILSSLAIVQFIINAIYNEYQERYGQPEWPSGYTEEMVIGGFLGSVIESHYPARNAENIPRNTRIVITFKQKIKPNTLIVDTNGDNIFGNHNETTGVSDQINSNNIKIYATDDKEVAALGMKPATEDDDVYAYLSADGRTVVFQPKNSLGADDKDVNYTVKLIGGDNGVKLFDGTNAFSGIGGYYWQFTVNTKEDKDPPKVESVFPAPSNSPYKRNVIVQMNFNEAVDPISASGILKADGSQNFQNITIVSSTAAGPVMVSGEYKIANQYRTIEFVSDNLCGTNPCGQPIFCLPANSAVSTTIKTATLSDKPPQAMITANLYDGVVDMAGNALNGGGELKLVGIKLQLLPGLKEPADWQKGEASFAFDNFFWKFQTSDKVDASAPAIQSINPSLGVGSEGVAKDALLTITFSKPMSISSFRDIILKTNKDFNVWYTPAGHNFKNAAGDPAGLTDSIHHTQAELLHGDFWQKPVGSTEDEAIYYPFVPSTVTDIFQNCFYPAEHIGTTCVTSTHALNDNTPSCFDNTPSSYKGFCGAGDSSCPFGTGLKP